MKYYTLESLSHDWGKETVRAAVDGEMAMMLDILKMGGHIRAPSSGEVGADYNAVQDTEADDDRHCLLYPEDREKIIKLVQDWNSPLSLDGALRIIAERCNEECRTPGEAYDFLQKNYPNSMDPRMTRGLFDILNFEGVRENAEGLRSLALDSLGRDFRMRRAGLS